MKSLDVWIKTSVRLQNPAGVGRLKTGPGFLKEFCTYYQVCANPDTTTACKWTRSCEEDIASQIPPTNPNNGALDATPGDLEFLVPGPDRSKIQKMFSIPPRSPLQLQHTGVTLNYDNLEVEVAWKVVNKVSGLNGDPFVV